MDSSEKTKKEPGEDEQQIEYIEITVPPKSLDNDQSEPLAIPHSPGLIVLQWLTYVFWGWTILAMLWLTFIVAAAFIIDMDATSVIPYAIAGTFVLFPLSFVLDAFYGKREPTQKTGAATAVMVVHTVIFALCGIGVLVGAVFVAVQMFLNPTGDHRLQMTVLWMFIVGAAIYGLTFLRTLNLSPKIPIARTYKFIMAAVVGVLVIMMCIGPIQNSFITRDDRDIMANISTLNDAIRDNTIKNNKLPTSLYDLSLQPGERSIIDRHLVAYKPEGKITAVDLYSADRVSDEYQYQLCVSYKKAASNAYLGDNVTGVSKDVYQDSLYITDHPAGDICYRLKVTDTTEPLQDISVSAQKND